MTNTAYESLGAAGPLAAHIHNYSVREPQQQMAAAVYDALQDTRTLIVEAGTGTGKTFAYLVPAILSGKKTIISTGTKTLQDQLFQRDLPLVQRALGLPLQTAMLKGRANYLCLHRLALAQQHAVTGTRRLHGHLQQIRAWAGRTVAGDIAEVDQVPEDSPVWPAVTSTIDNCVGPDCDEYQACYVVKARREAQHTDILVVNHHLLLADMLLRDTGFGELLPGAEVFIIDEAHQLPEIASVFLGSTLSYRQLNELIRDVEVEYVNAFGTKEQLGEATEQLRRAINDFRLTLDRGSDKQVWDKVVARQAVSTAFDSLCLALERFCDWAAELQSETEGLKHCFNRVSELLQRLQAMADHDHQQYVCWLETQPGTFVWHLTPVDIAEQFQEMVAQHHASWVFTSATLAVGDSFDHFVARLGIETEYRQRYTSPFSYEDHALLYLPAGLPDPDQPAYVRSVTEAALPVINACAGGVFFLFTSYRALNQAARLVEGNTEKAILIQGQAPRRILIEQFREAGDALLLATSSFWEGVDVRGKALSCVIIDKLPFASPSDPVLQARINRSRKEGGNPFMELQLPQAVIALKQGVGRLIRDVDDTGVMVLCDPRLTNKPYGRVFLRSLPPMRRTRDLEDVLEFVVESGIGTRNRLA